MCGSKIKTPGEIFLLVPPFKGGLQLGTLRNKGAPVEDAIP